MICSQGRTFLWAVNLFQKALIKIDVSGSPASLPGTVNQYLLASLPGYPTSTTGVLRPFGLSFHGGKGYLGVVADASISKVNTDLKTYVLSFDPNNIMAGFTTVLNFDPNIKRGSYDQFTQFNYWMSVWNSTLIASWGTYATPVVSDIEFDANDNMYIAIMDRFGHQIGAWNYKAISGNTETNMQGNAQGEILKACKTTTGYSIEGSGTCAPSGSTGFFSDSAGDGNNESCEGAVAILKGSNKIVAISLDPHPQGVQGEPYWSTQGVNTYDLTTGNIANWYSVYNGDIPLYGKANGLGDLEFIVPEQPIEVGNRVWTDTNKNGIQDAGEAGIDGVTVLLFEGTTQVGTTTTANGGQYYFTNANVTGGVKSNTAYEIRIATAQTPLSTLALTTTDVGTNGSDLVDNDGTVSSTNVIKTFTTGLAGSEQPQL